MKIRFGSRKGASLVEEICAAMVLVIAVAALAGGIGMSRGSVSRSNTEDAAAARAQDVADTLVAVLSSKTDRAAGDVLGNDTAEYVEDGKFSASGAEKQYAYEPVDETKDGPAGYEITVRVYYGGSRYCQLKAFAADTGGAFANAAA